jgi:hypothetical protein
MPVINGRHYMNPGRGQRIERSRITEAFRGLGAQAQAHPTSWMGRLIDHLTSSRSVNEPPPHPKPPGMPPEAYDHMKVNKLTVAQIANIVANENRDVTPGTSAPEELQRAKTAQAHTIINADRTWGTLRDTRAHTAPTDVTASIEHSPQYKQALEAARTAFQEQFAGQDPVGGRMHFNNRPTASTALHRIGDAKVPLFGKPYGPFQRGKDTVYTDIYENPPNDKPRK